MDGAPIGSRRVRVPAIAPGSSGDRLYHLFPQLGPLLAGGYRAAERTTRPRLIHAHFATTGYLVGVVTTSPLVVSAYGFDISAMARRRLWRMAYRRLANRASAVLVEGPFMRDRVIELGFAPEAVRIVRIAADLQDITFREPSVVDGRPLRLLTCGRLVEKKGHAVAIQAFSAIRHDLPMGSTLEVVGDGPLAGDLRALADRLSVADGVSFAGSVSRASFHDRLARSDLFVAPSVTARNGDSEGGAPTTILDAQATGTVVVASTHADIPFLVENDVTGYLATEGDPDALGRRITDAFLDRARWSAIANAARSSVLDNHSDDAIARTLQAIYREVIGPADARD